VAEARMNPEQHPDLQSHPAVMEMRRLQLEWAEQGIKDPRIEAYIFAHSKAQQAGLNPFEATLFAAKAATGK
jgi:hypothetical protein